MGAISKARAAGFGDNLLLPIIPHDGTKDARAGKAPGTLNTSGNWVGLSKWAEQGVDSGTLTALDKLKANCGLRLGRPGPAGETLVFLDGDTEPGADLASRDGKVALAICAIIHTTVASYLKKPFWVRKSRPGRTGILFRIAAGQDAGTKDVLHLSNIENAGVVKSRGKIEVLAHGQQCVIGGIHPFNNGTPIEWRKSNDADKVEDAPEYASIPLLPSRESLTEIILAIKDSLESKGITTTRRAGKMSSDFSEMSAEEKTPPSAQDLINTLNALPHDDRVVRQDYVNIMRSVAECIRGLELRNDDFDVTEIEEAAVDWAARWPGADYETEESKWSSDFKNSSSDSLGWPVIQFWAERLGVQAVIAKSAEDDFEDFIEEVDAEVEPDSTALILAKAELAAAPRKKTSGLKINDSVLPKDTGSRADKKRKSGDVHLIDVPSAEIQIADSIQTELQDFVRYVPSEKRWIIWSGITQGWSHPEGSLLMEKWIQDELAAYLLREGSGWNEATRAKILSQSKVSNIERMLRSRLFVRSDSLNAVPCTLQTPAGSFDLKTGRKMHWEEQRALMDTRCTNVAPVPGPHPTFDRLLSHLTCGDSSTQDWILHYLGYLLLGRPLAHILLIVYGPGGNGKGAFDSFLQSILGSYGVTLDKGVVLDSGRKEHKTGLYEVKGKRYWGVSEIRPGEAWNEAQVQAMTGGDVIKARGMGQDMQSIKPEGSFLIFTNHLPRFHQINNAIARRFRFLNARWVPDRPDPLLGDKLALEAPAVLATLMEYAAKVSNLGFQMPATPAPMQDSANELFAEQDAFFSWFNTHILRSFKDAIPYAELRGSFSSFKLPGEEDTDDVFPDGSSNTTLSDADFRMALKRSGLPVTRGRLNGRLTEIVAGVRWHPEKIPKSRGSE